MSVTITITKTLDDDWAGEKTFAQMSDAEILELVQEDIHELVNGACWLVERHEDE